MIAFRGQETAIRVGDGIGIVAERDDGVDQRCWLLGYRPVELVKGLPDVVDGEGGIDAAKPFPGCVCVVSVRRLGGTT